MNCSAVVTKFFLLGVLLSVANAYIPIPSRSFRTRVVEEEPLTQATTSPNLWAMNELRARQATSTSTTYTITIAPDETCGYLSGAAGAAITCTNNEACTWVADPPLGIWCGDDVHDDCLPMSVALDPNECNDVCQSDTFTLKW